MARFAVGPRRKTFIGCSRIKHIKGEVCPVVFRGDVDGGEASWESNGGLICMSTAIARFYTPEGFVIAADGRKRDAETHSIVNDNTQKIFGLSGMQIGYALMGIIELSPEGSKEISFDFCNEIAKSAQDLTGRKSKNLFGYATRLSKPINRRLADARRSGMISPYPVQPSKIAERGHTIVRLYLDGYYQGIPSRVNVRFFHENQKLSEPEIMFHSLNLNGLLTLGPAIVLGLFNNNDERFARYHRYRKNWDGTLSGAVEECKNYILAFSSPEALEADQEGSSGVGGHTHVATITLASGFKWAPGLEPVTL